MLSCLHFNAKVDMYCFDCGITELRGKGRGIQSENMHMHSSLVGLLCQSILATLPAYTALLEPTEGYLHTHMVGAIDPCRSRFQSIRNANRSVNVLRKDGGGETVSCIVRLSDHIFFVMEFDHDADGPKYLFLDNFHIGARICEYSWLDEIALGTDTLSTCMHCRTVRFSGFDIAHDPIKLDLGYLRALICICSERVSDTDCLRPLGEARDKFVVDISMYKDARASSASLALIPEDTVHRPIDGL